MSLRDLVALHIVAQVGMSNEPASYWQRIRRAFGLRFAVGCRPPAAVARDAFNFAEAFVAEKARRDG